MKGVRVNYKAIQEHLQCYCGDSAPSVEQIKAADQDGTVLIWAMEHAPECVRFYYGLSFKSGLPGLTLN